MKDLDFDELDRAVNSLMSNVPKSAPAQLPEDKEKTLDIKPTLSDGAMPSFDTIEKTASKPTLPSPTSLPTPSKPRSMSDITSNRPSKPVLTPSRPQPVGSAPATRRKFMDVVRPTSAASTTDKVVSRQGTTIEPAGDSVALKTATIPEHDETPKPVESPVAAPTATEEVSVASDWPDPLDMQPKKTQDVALTNEEPQKDVSTTGDMDIAPSVQDDQDSAQTEPLTSPFLPDAKVEKRPLGGMTNDLVPTPPGSGSPLLEPVEPATDNESTVVETPSISVSDTNEEEAEAVNAPDESKDLLPSSDSGNGQVPEELSSDLIAVEADTTHDELKKEHDSTVNSEKSSEKDMEKPERHEGGSIKSDAQPVGPTSISQQYHESPSTGDKDSGSIYDTSTYHQPLPSPAKKGSHRALVLWIIVIILVGIAAGVALYFSGII